MPAARARLGPGTYILSLHVGETRRIVVGRLGALDFSRGAYLYVGSALGGLEGRLRRHLRENKRLHWHIDYLLTCADVREVWYREGEERLECEWARSLLQRSWIHPFEAPFGASDCRCRTHLLVAEQHPRLELLRAQLQAGSTLKAMRPEVLCPGGTDR